MTYLAKRFALRDNEDYPDVNILSNHICLAIAIRLKEITLSQMLKFLFLLIALNLNL